MLAGIVHLCPMVVLSYMETGVVAISYLELCINPLSAFFYGIIPLYPKGHQKLRFELSLFSTFYE